MEKFSDDILLNLLDYFRFHDQICFTMSIPSFCRSYMKNYVRKIFLQGSIIHESNPSLFSINSPSKQLSLIIPSRTSDFYFPFQGLCSLECEYETFCSLLSKLPDFCIERIKLVTLSRSDPNYYRITNSLHTALNHLQKLSKESWLKNLELTEYHEELDPDEEEEEEMLQSFPFFENLHSLNLFMFRFLRSFSSEFLTTNLQVLKLESLMNLENVSMLGNIPDLTIRDCGRLKTISCLNNNRRICLIDNPMLRDFAHFGANSERITIDHRVKEISLSFLHWKAVKVLSLDLSKVRGEPKIFFVDDCRLLPSTLRRCTLGEKLASLLNLPPKHEFSSVTRKIYSQDYNLMLGR